MPRAAFATLGCKVNQFETDVIQGLFQARGYEQVDFDQPADVYVINTCSVTHLGEKKSRQYIRRAVRSNPDAVVVVTGCFAQLAPDKIEAIPGVDVVVGTQDRKQIVDLAEAARERQRPITAVTNIMSASEFEDIPLLSLPGHTRAYLKIQEGCNNFCTYCIIPYARGPLRSRPLDSIRSEAEKLAAAGFKEIVLTGIHLGAYGRDQAAGLTLADAVKAVLAVKDVARIRLSSLESIEVSDELIELMHADERVCRHLHLPLQSGSDAVLKGMHRHYTTAQFKDLLASIAACVPDIAFSTDIIVGFPGETEEMNESALQFAEELDLARLHIFPYSRRQGTPAAEYPDQVPEPEKKRRARQWQVLAEEKAHDYAARFIGRVMPVLFETHDKGIIDGLTGNYIRIYCEGSSRDAGKIELVRLEKHYRDGLWGVLER